MSKFLTLAVIAAFFAVASSAEAQSVDTPYQIRFLSNLGKKDAVVHLTNAGAVNNSICANVYTYAPSGALLDCCGCLIPRNSLHQLSASADLLPTTDPKPDSVLVKILATTGTSSSDCDPGTSATGGDSLTTGLLAWASSSLPKKPKVGADAMQTAFSPGTLSAGELTLMNSSCLALHPSVNTCAACQ